MDHITLKNKKEVYPVIKNLDNFKGIYNEDEEIEQKFFEHGSHFKYKELCCKLEEILTKINSEGRASSNSKFIAKTAIFKSKNNFFNFRHILYKSGQQKDIRKL